MSPAPGRPTFPRASATFSSARTLSDPNACCVIPIDQTKTAEPEARYISAKARSPSSPTPLIAPRSATVWRAHRSRTASKPVAWSRTNASSSPPSSISSFSTPVANASSPPVFTWKKASVMRVPSRALSGLDGTQYRSSPGSRCGLTTATLVPSRRAR